MILKQGRSLLTASTAMVSEARLVGAGRSGQLRIAFKAQSTAHFMPEIEVALRSVAMLDVLLRESRRATRVTPVDQQPDQPQRTDAFASGAQHPASRRDGGLARIT